MTTNQKPDAEGMTAAELIANIRSREYLPGQFAYEYRLGAWAFGDAEALLARYLAHHRAADLQTIKGLRAELAHKEKSTEIGYGVLAERLSELESQISNLASGPRFTVRTIEEFLARQFPDLTRPGPEYIAQFCTEIATRLNEFPIGLVETIAVLESGVAQQDVELKALRTTNAEQAARMARLYSEREHYRNLALFELPEKIATLEAQHAADVERIGELEQQMAALHQDLYKESRAVVERWRFADVHACIVKHYSLSDVNPIRLEEQLATIASERKGGA